MQGFNLVCNYSFGRHFFFFFFRFPFPCSDEKLASLENGVSVDLMYARSLLQFLPREHSF